MMRFLKSPEGRGRGNGQLEADRRYAPHRPMSANTRFSMISLALVMGGAIFGGGWWGSKMEHAIAANRDDIVETKGALQAIDGTLGKVDILLKSAEATDRNSEILSDMRSQLAVLIVQMRRVQLDLSEIKEDRRRGNP